MKMRYKKIPRLTLSLFASIVISSAAYADTTSINLNSGEVLTWQDGQFINICKEESTTQKICSRVKMSKKLGLISSITAGPNIANARATWKALTATDTYVCSVLEGTTQVGCAKVPTTASKPTRTGMKTVTLDPAAALEQTRTLLEGELAYSRVSSASTTDGLMLCDQGTGINPCDGEGEQMPDGQWSCGPTETVTVVAEEDRYLDEYVEVFPDPFADFDGMTDQLQQNDVEFTLQLNISKQEKYQLCTSAAQKNLGSCKVDAKHHNDILGEGCNRSKNASYVFGGAGVISAFLGAEDSALVLGLFAIAYDHEEKDCSAAANDTYDELKDICTANYNTYVNNVCSSYLF